MGLERTVTFAGDIPGWPAVCDLLAGRGAAVQMRMIDGELAFPDEEPPEAWRELRLSLGGGMVTVRRGAGQVSLVVWGNADAALLQAWDLLAWAFAEAGGGRVLTEAGPQSAADFRRAANLPP
jgi:hypothetical protein